MQWAIGVELAMGTRYPTQSKDADPHTQDSRCGESNHGATQVDRRISDDR